MTKPLPHPKYLQQRYKKLSLSFKWIDPTAIVLIGILSVSIAFAFRGFLTDNRTSTMNLMIIRWTLCSAVDFSGIKDKIPVKLSHIRAK